MKALSFIAVICLTLAGSLVQSGLAQASEDRRARQLEDEKKKLGERRGPQDRTESLMKIAEILLSYMGDAAKADDFSKVRSDLDDYKDAVAKARDIMMGSGLCSVTRGYMVLESETRKHLPFPRTGTDTFPLDRRSHLRRPSMWLRARELRLFVPCSGDQDQ